MAVDDLFHSKMFQNFLWINILFKDVAGVSV